MSCIYLEWVAADSHKKWNQWCSYKGQWNKYWRHKLCKSSSNDQSFTIRNIPDSNADAQVSAAITAWNGSSGMWEWVLTQHIVAPAIFLALSLLYLHHSIELETQEAITILYVFFKASFFLQYCLMDLGGIPHPTELQGQYSLFTLLHYWWNMADYHYFPGQTAYCR